MQRKHKLWCNPIYLVPFLFKTTTADQFDEAIDEHVQSILNFSILFLLLLLCCRYSWVYFSIETMFIYYSGQGNVLISVKKHVGYVRSGHALMPAGARCCHLHLHTCVDHVTGPQLTNYQTSPLTSLHESTSIKMWDVCAVTYSLWVQWLWRDSNKITLKRVSREVSTNF